MPFTKTGDNSYTSPSGRHFNGAQVRLYYANGGHFPGEKGYAQGGTVNKGYLSKTEGYAAGGPVLGRSRSFLKEPDGADQTVRKFEPYKNPDLSEQDYGKTGGPGGKDSKLTGDKSLKAVKPRG